LIGNDISEILIFRYITIIIFLSHCRSIVSSEVSEEDLELLSKTINLSGFDDNISPCNHINLLFRFAIGEVSTHRLIIF